MNSRVVVLLALYRSRALRTHAPKTPLLTVRIGWTATCVVALVVAISLGPSKSGAMNVRAPAPPAAPPNLPPSIEQCRTFREQIRQFNHEYQEEAETVVRQADQTLRHGSREWHTAYEKSARIRDEGFHIEYDSLWPMFSKCLKQALD
jgi:hypothetical protein